jgi:hypothetical protein
MYVRTPCTFAYLTSEQKEPFSVLFPEKCVVRDKCVLTLRTTLNVCTLDRLLVSYTPNSKHSNF